MYVLRYANALFAAVQLLRQDVISVAGLRTQPYAVYPVILRKGLKAVYDREAIGKFGDKEQPSIELGDRRSRCSGDLIVYLPNA